MDVRNDTDFAHGLALGRGPEGRPCLGVVVKATFALPEGARAAPTLAEEQIPVQTSDEFHQGDLTGSLRLERDDVPFKPRADVVLVGHAYAPAGRPARSVDVLLQVGTLRKALRVFGDRQWLLPSRAVVVPVITEPEPFHKMPLVYERAFGGSDRHAGTVYAANPVGRGFLGKKSRASVNEQPLPNVEDPACLVAAWSDAPAPAGFGFYHPGWQPRLGYAGSAEGLAQPDPLFGLAADFRPDFYNGAHPELQVPGYLRGDEAVDLINFTPDGRRQFRLPGLRPEIILHHATSGDEASGPTASTAAHPLEAVLDTLVLLPDDGLFYQVWRGAYPLPDDLGAGLAAIATIDIRMAAPSL